MANFIGLGGKLRSGKDTVADYLVEQYDWVKLNMSDPLNTALLALNPIVAMYPVYDGADGGVQGVRYSQLYRRVGYVEAKKNPEVRRLLQALGTEVGRDMIDENVWVNIAKKKIQKLLDGGTSVAITGIRFPNEFEMVRNLGGVAVWVERPGLEVPGSDLAAHASETSVTSEDFDRVLSNDGTLEDLYDTVDDFVVGLEAAVATEGTLW